MHSTASTVFEATVFFDDTIGTPSFRKLDEEQSSRGFHLTRMITKQTDSGSGRILKAQMVWQHHASPLAAPGGNLGILFPVLNCKGLLEQQVDAISSWLDLVSEIVVIDSGSTDDTAEYLTRRFKSHPRVRVVHHPRGLWQSWNAGLALMTTDYVHIATAGDAMDRDGIKHLLEVVKTTNADIVISPPRIRTHDGSTPPCTRWVIHEMLERFQITSPQLINPTELLYWTYWYAGGAPAILGSSASNLYRVRLFQEFPFPTDASTAGDCAWGLLHIHRAKVAFTPKECADFIYHPAEGRPSMSQLRRILFTHACRGAGIEHAEGEAAATPIESQLDALAQAKAKQTVIKRKWRGLALLNPEMWYLKTLCSKLEERIQLKSNLPRQFKAYLERFIECGGFRTDV